MKITSTNIEVHFDISDLPPYEAVSSWEPAGATRTLKPFTATVNNAGSVKVTGKKVKKSGGLYSTDSSIEYWIWGEGVDAQPGFVKELRRTAAQFRVEAVNAWETTLEAQGEAASE